jgi:C2H2-type zinc finger
VNKKKSKMSNSDSNNAKRVKLSTDVKQRFNCDQCQKSFSDKSNLLRHKKSVHNVVIVKKKFFKCRFCDASFSRTDNRSQHEKKKHPQVTQVCQASTSSASTSTSSTAVYKPIKPQTPASKFYGDNVKVSASAFKSRIAIFQILNNENLIDAGDFLKQISNVTASILCDSIVEHTNIKYNMGLICSYIMPKVDDHDEEPSIVEVPHFTKMKVLTRSSSIEDSFCDNTERILAIMSEYQGRGSGWSLTKIVRLEVNVNQYNPLRGNSFIDLPAKIKNTKAIINIRNADEYCFAWAVNSALHEAAQNTDRTSSYPHYTRSMNLGDIQFPMKVTDVKKFELINPTISINVYGLEGGKLIGPYYHTDKRKIIHINLLHLQQGDKTHYCLIKNMSG